MNYKVKHPFVDFKLSRALKSGDIVDDETIIERAPVGYLEEVAEQSAPEIEDTPPIKKIKKEHKQ